MFEGYVGNENLKSRLSSLVQTGGLGHAVLLIGEDGCGRNALALKLAAAYLDDKVGMAARGVHPDLLTLAGTGVMNQISVEAMRKALTELSYSAVTTDGKRALIIKNAASLNRSSAAALLKTLEEPVPGILFIITASSANDIIDTVASRCTKYMISSPSAEECASYVKSVTNAGSAEIRKLSELCGGRIGLVLHYLRNDSSAESLKYAEAFAEAYIKNDTALMMSFASKPADRKAVKQFWTEVTLLLMKQHYKTGAGQIAQDVDLIQKSVIELEGNLNIRLFATRMCLALTH